ncbi:MAG TPA: family 10 glycosylhydrolase [Candidatus Hydrogenedentes bacterium]|nr:family 10 glycosylhydrolase [Candidatus Hydrogenedentota bacterium]HQE81359.1 family 10 glycosylhydrolase [Candidatus Hydrogenedentota bacterium]HQM47044.1 family 10 glycosylhydrolase [Candidatus Hydrogenedentota bacterium]
MKTSPVCSIVALLLLTAIAWPGAGAGESPAEPSEKLILSAPVTHSDWMLRDGVAWGPDGVRHMLDMCKASGWNRVYWRVLDGGRSLYKSALLNAQGKWDEDNFWHPVSAEDKAMHAKYTGGMSEADRAALLAKLERYDYGTFDTLAEAVRYGHEIGLEIHAWISINEDDHGWGIQSRFSKEHPDTRWRKRDGTLYRSQHSFAYPEVMQYKLAVVEEIIANYGVDGVFLDWIRTGDVRDNPQNDAEGVADRGYETPLVEGFKKRYGIDPHEIPNSDERWVRYRALPHTEFMRGVRTLVTAKRPSIPIAVMVMQPWGYRGFQDKIDGNLRGMLLDVETWAREGLIDAAVAAGYYLEGGSAELAYKALQAETGNKVDVWLYEWVPDNVEDFKQNFGVAQQVGARQILFWEGDYIDGRENKEELQAYMRAHAQETEPGGK